MGGEGGTKGAPRRTDRSPLWEACSQGSTAAVRGLLAAKADCTSVDKDGNAPLHAAAARGHAHLVRHLVEAKSDINVRGHLSRTPLYAAVAELGYDQSAAATCRALLEQKADPNATDEGGRPPLSVAARRGMLTMAQILIDFGAEVGWFFSSCHFQLTTK